MKDTERSATAVGDAGPAPQPLQVASNVDSRELALQWRRLIRRIDRLTEPSRYRFQFSQSQDGTVLLVLDPPSLDEGNGE